MARSLEALLEHVPCARVRRPATTTSCSGRSTTTRRTRSGPEVPRLGRRDADRSAGEVPALRPAVHQPASARRLDLLELHRGRRSGLRLAAAGARAHVRGLAGAHREARRTPGTLLDIGTAAGGFLAAATARGWKAEGCEPNRWLAEWGARHYGVRIRPGGVFDQDYEPASFDVVTLWDVIEHTTNPRAVLEHCRSLLKPGGVLVVNYPDIGSWIARALGRRWLFLTSVHLHYFDRRTMRGCSSRRASRSLVRPHVQRLELDYMLARGAILSSRLVPGARGVSSQPLGLARTQVPYWLGQTFVAARRLGASSPSALLAPSARCFDSDALHGHPPPGLTSSQPRSAAPKARERADRDEPVLRTDLLAFLAAARVVADRDLDDALSTGEHARGDLVIQLEARGFERQRGHVGAAEELVGGDRVGQIAAGESQTRPGSGCGRRDRPPATGSRAGRGPDTGCRR